MQPIIRGIQAVGSVTVRYKYNSDAGLTLPATMKLGGKTAANIDCGSKFVECTGFRLDSNFLRANPQIASSFMIPILGGGAVALTNNNRSGTLSIATTRVSTPATEDEADQTTETILNDDGTVASQGATVYGSKIGSIPFSDTLGIATTDQTKGVFYDLTFLLQAQQGQEGGDSVGATIQVDFMFNGLHTTLEFQGCTVASIDPVGLSGNDAVDYNAQINYLNWIVNYSNDSGTAQ